MAEKENIIREESAQADVVSRLHGDKVIWVIFFLLSLISIALIYSSSSSLAYMKGSTNFAILMKQFSRPSIFSASPLFVVLGLAALYICYKVPPRWWRTLSIWSMLLAIGLLVLTLAIGKTTNDAQRWLSIGGIQFQPAEFAKVAIVLYLARALEIQIPDSFWEEIMKAVK